MKVLRSLDKNSFAKLKSSKESSSRDYDPSRKKLGFLGHPSFCSGLKKSPLEKRPRDLKGCPFFLPPLKKLPWLKHCVINSMCWCKVVVSQPGGSFLSGGQKPGSLLKIGGSFFRGSFFRGHFSGQGAKTWVAFFSRGQKTGEFFLSGS